MRTQNLIINEDLSVNAYNSFNGFFQGEKNRFFVAKLCGWALDDGYELYLSFQNAESSSIERKLLYDSGADSYFIPVPEEVMRQLGEWTVKVVKKYPDAGLTKSASQSLSFTIHETDGAQNVELEDEDISAVTFNVTPTQGEEAVMQSETEPTVPKYKKAKITIDADLTIHPIGGFDSLSQNSIDTQIISATLNGWALEDGAALFFAFEKLYDGYNYSIKPIITAMDFQLNTFWIRAPDELMKVSGEWRMCVYKKFGFNQATGTADKSISGVPFSFTVRNSIKDSIDENITVYDLANMLETYKSIKKQEAVCFDVSIDSELWEHLGNRWEIYIPQPKHGFKNVNSVVAEKINTDGSYENMIYGLKYYKSGSVSIILDEKTDTRIVIKGDK